MYHNDIPMIHLCSIAITHGDHPAVAIHQAPRQELRLRPLRPDLMSGVRCQGHNLGPLGT